MANAAATLESPAQTAPSTATCALHTLAQPTFANYQIVGVLEQIFQEE
jgi:hypothetical protein